MFKSVLIAEDQQVANASIKKMLQEAGVEGIAYAYYCDDALLLIKHRLQEGAPFDLLVTDLSFAEDGRTQSLKTGQELILAARQLQPGLKVLTFSAEQRPAIITDLFERYHINGYVKKARRDAEHLKEAIEAIYKNKHYLPEGYRQQAKQMNAFSLTHYDVSIIKLLSNGIRQKNIPDHLKEEGLSPISLSSIEKRLNQIREALCFVKNEQLVAYCKDQGII
jgi:two-component system capsular synthesis response regulator RcsB